MRQMKSVGSDEEIDGGLRECRRLIRLGEHALRVNHFDPSRLGVCGGCHNDAALPASDEQQPPQVVKHSPLVLHRPREEKGTVGEQGVDSVPQLQLDGALDRGTLVNEAQSVVVAVGDSVGRQLGVLRILLHRQRDRTNVENGDGPRRTGGIDPANRFTIFGCIVSGTHFGHCPILPRPGVV